MSVEENKRLVRRYIEEIVNSNDVDRLGEFVSADYTETGDSPDLARGPQRARDHLLAVRTTFPDLTLTVTQQIAEGDWVVTRVSAQATHLGTWMGIKPTGKRVVLHGVNIDRVVGGRIVEHGGAADMLVPLLQAGAVHV